MKKTRRLAALAGQIMALDTTERAALFAMLRGDRPAPTRAAILEVCSAAARPLKGAVIAARIGKLYGGYIRELLSDLVLVGELAHVEGGYIRHGAG